jgi:hypothetical protein
MVRCARRVVRGARGQATVELVAIIPAVAAVALAVLQLLAAGMTAALAGHAAEAGAVALLQDRDPREAARKSVPGWSRSAMEVRITGSRVAVTMRPPSPSRAIADELATTAHADAGKGAR